MKTSCRILTIAAILAVLALGGIRAYAQGADTLTGWLSVIWGDDESGQPVPPQILLSDDDSNVYRLEVSPETAEQAGGLATLNRARVTVRGAWLVPPAEVTTQGDLSALPVLQVDFIQAEERLPVLAALTGSQPWVTILCKFSDVAAEPEQKPFFQTLMGSAFPGMDDYWREVSYNNINVSGSIVVGWFTIGKRSAYGIPGNTYAYLVQRFINMFRIRWCKLGLKGTAYERTETQVQDTAP